MSASPESQNTLNPFPGLRPFRTDEDYLFFGREEQTASLLTLLREHRFLAVVGASGSGKSSLVRAGLIPALHGGTMTRAGSHWEVAVFRPGGDPITNLARSLLDADLLAACRTNEPRRVARRMLKSLEERRYRADTQHRPPWRTNVSVCRPPRDAAGGANLRA